MTEIINGSNRYRVIKEVARSEHYHLYLCKQKETQCQCLLQIAITVEHNGELQRAAYILRELAFHADRLEEEYKNVKTDPNVLLNYQLGFPEVVDSFICQEQGRRQINIFAFRNVDDVADMVPLANITTKDNLRIDLRTSAWIMGKALKLLDFVYGQGISVDLMTGENILINAKQHYVVIFDLVQAQIFEQMVPKDIRGREISQTASAVIIALGGDVKTGIFPENDSREYIDYLLQMARGNVSNAKRAHEDFYEIVDRIWKREFYPFTVEQLK
ncbi:MAG: hypothetical protein KAI71_00535 [Candidatus Pacebacteria bacterium]|nr:hypothetical protein [Candidatus Paceibacterota bacterium]